MVSEQQAGAFAQDWIEAWNNHDLDRILEHYAEDVVFTSPFALRLAPDSEGRVKGKQALRAYFDRALKAYPELRFEFGSVLRGVTGVTLVYTSVGGRQAAETMLFDQAGRVAVVHAHYNPV